MNQERIGRCARAAARGMTSALSVTVLAAAIATFFAGARLAAAEGDVNACGCRQTGQGMCVCEKKSKCGCPGECEPKGCEEKRAKRLEKEIQAETKKAEEASRRQGHDGAARKAGKERDEGGEDATSGAAPGAPRATNAPRATKMSAAQRKDLAKLLGLYLGDHPDEAGKTIEQLRGDLTAAARSK